MNTSKTTSEGAFEDFLNRNGIAFTPIPPAAGRRPDYSVTCGAATVIFEVKQLSEDSDFSTEQFKVSTRTIGQHIRKKISEARTQIQFGAKEGHSTVLLIYNNLDPMHRFGTEDHDFQTAMHGEFTVNIGLQTGAIGEVFHGRNRSVEAAKNTSFSALGRLAPFGHEREFRVTLFENTFAKNPLPYDQLPPCFSVIRDV